MDLLLISSALAATGYYIKTKENIYSSPLVKKVKDYVFVEKNEDNPYKSTIVEKNNEKFEQSMEKRYNKAKDPYSNVVIPGIQKTPNIFDGTMEDYVNYTETSGNVRGNIENFTNFELIPNKLLKPISGISDYLSTVSGLYRKPSKKEVEINAEDDRRIVENPYDKYNTFYDQGSIYIGRNTASAYEELPDTPLYSTIGPNLNATLIRHIPKSYEELTGRITQVMEHTDNVPDSKNKVFTDKLNSSFKKNKDTSVETLKGQIKGHGMMNEPSIFSQFKKTEKDNRLPTPQGKNLPNYDINQSFTINDSLLYNNSEWTTFKPINYQATRNDDIYTPRYTSKDYNVINNYDGQIEGQDKYYTPIDKENVRTSRRNEVAYFNDGARISHNIIPSKDNVNNTRYRNEMENQRTNPSYIIKDILSRERGKETGSIKQTNTVDLTNRFDYDVNLVLKNKTK